MEGFSGLICGRPIKNGIEYHQIMFSQFIRTKNEDNLWGSQYDVDVVHQLHMGLK